MTRIDIVAPRQSFHHLGRPVAQALAADHDQRAGVGFDGIARPDIGGAVVADNLPIGAARKDAAVEFGSIHASAEDADDAPLAVRRAAETGHGLEFGAN